MRTGVLILFYLGLAASTMAFFALIAAGFSAHRAQFFVFPLFLIAWGFFAPSWIKFKRLSLAALAIAWLTVGLSDRSALPRFFKSVALAELDGDKESSNVDSFRQGYRRIARAYDLPTMRLLGRKLTAKEKTSGIKDALFTLSGDKDRLVATLGSAFRKFPPSLEQVVGQADFLIEAKGGSLSGDDLVREIALDSRLIWLTGSDTFSLPNFDPSLSQFFIAWLAEAARLGDELEGSKNQSDILKLRAASIQALSHAAEVGDLWRVPTPKGVSRLLLANEVAYEALRSGDSGEMKCALGLYQEAGSYLQDPGDRAWFLKVLNNAAVLLAHSDMEALDGSSRDKIVSWLSRASEFKDSSGKPLPASNVAVYNLRRFLLTN